MIMAVFFLFGYLPGGVRGVVLPVWWQAKAEQLAPGRFGRQEVSTEVCP
jgi:hypothetical protein